MSELPLKVLFIDRDGTIIFEPDDFQVDDLSKVKFVPNVIGTLKELKNEGLRTSHGKQSRRFRD